eukprot:6832231-Ditylum_brightwellii.AAC.1
MVILPTDKEIHKTISQLNNLTAGASGIRAETFKALATEEETFITMRSIIHKCWQNEEQPTKFDIGCLGILPQKGDLSKP